MHPFLDQPRIATLLQEADHALSLIQSMRNRGLASKEVAEALAGIYRDLGEALHVHLRDGGDPAGQAPPRELRVGGLEDHPGEGVDPETLEIDWSMMLEAEAEADDMGAAEPTDEMQVLTAEDLEAAVGFLPPEPTEEGPVAADPPGLATSADDELTDPGHEERWYTDEVEIEGPPQPLFTPEDGLREDVPEADPVELDTGRIEPLTPEKPKVRRVKPVQVMAVGPAPAPPSEDDEDRMRVIDADGAHEVGPDGEWVAASLEPGNGGGGVGTQWLPMLEDILDLLGEPIESADPHALAAETTRVQLATANIQGRWSTFPPAVQLALLGLISARSRHLAQYLELDIGPRLALDRMRRYRKGTGLGQVTGLVPGHAPEYDAWSEDAMHWWRVLRKGLAS